MPNPNLALRASVRPLSKVWNREYAVQRLTAELAMARRTPGYQFSILLIQADGFSLTGRDRLGFAAGNDVAPRVFALLTDELRETEACCHLADDEFLLILPHRDEAESRSLAGLLKAQWSPRPGSRGAAIRLRAGWASSAGEDSSIEKLFAAADDSLSRAFVQEGRDVLMDVTPFETTAVRMAAAAAQPLADRS